MARRKQIDYQCPSGKHSEVNYEFAYELGAEVMMDKMQRKDEYLRKLKNNGTLEMGQDINQQNEKRRNNQNERLQQNNLELGQELTEKKERQQNKNQVEFSSDLNTENARHNQQYRKQSNQIEAAQDQDDLSNQQHFNQRQKQEDAWKQEENQVEFSNFETMRPLKEEYYADRDYTPSCEHEDFLLEKQHQSRKDSENNRKR